MLRGGSGHGTVRALVRWQFVFFEVLAIQRWTSIDGQVGFYVSGP
jgi:hypothetical protein